MTTLRPTALALTVLMALVLGLAVLVAAEDEPKAEPKGAAAPTLADLAWMVGDWADAEGPSIFAETWLPAQGHDMVGVAHWTVGGRTRMYELMSIEQRDDGLVLHVRHFHRGLVPWPSEVKGPVAWPLKSLQGEHAIFEHPTRAWPKRMEYKRSGDALSGRLSGTKDGKPHAIPFSFRVRK